MGDPTTGETLEHCHECRELTWHDHNQCQRCAAEKEDWEECHRCGDLVENLAVAVDPWGGEHETGFCQECYDDGGWQEPPDPETVAEIRVRAGLQR